MDYLFFIKSFVHYFLHFVFPGFIAWVSYKDDWKKVYLILLATMLVDLDHLLATPVFDPERDAVWATISCTLTMPLRSILQGRFF